MRVVEIGGLTFVETVVAHLASIIVIFQPMQSTNPQLETEYYIGLYTSGGGI